MGNVLSLASTRQARVWSARHRARQNCIRHTRPRVDRASVAGGAVEPSVGDEAELVAADVGSEQPRGFREAFFGCTAALVLQPCLQPCLQPGRPLGLPRARPHVRHLRVVHVPGRELVLRHGHLNHEAFCLCVFVRHQAVELEEHLCRDERERELRDADGHLAQLRPQARALGLEAQPRVARQGRRDGPREARQTVQLEIPVVR
mmetsp:Transcript_18022/g.41267  ORF Transcript_18022/g.41267 Transcript_18022/m.41267 type:complete len:204 (+) Transcript_18022:1097-1708(+)